MKSLQRRLFVGGGIWAVATTLIGTFALLAIFDQIATKHFDDELIERHTEIVRELFVTPDPENLAQSLPNAAYYRPFSGQYWQVTGVDGTLVRSVSLFDFELTTPEADGVMQPFEVPGPLNEVRGIIQKVSLPDGSSYSVSVA